MHKKIHRQSSYSIFLVVCLERCNFFNLPSLAICIQILWQSYPTQLPNQIHQSCLRFGIWMFYHSRIILHRKTRFLLIISNFLIVYYYIMFHFECMLSLKLPLLSWKEQRIESISWLLYAIVVYVLYYTIQKQLCKINYYFLLTVRVHYTSLSRFS